MPLFSSPPIPQQRRRAPPPSVQAGVVSSGAGSAAGTSTVQAIAPFGAGVSTGTSTVSAVGASLRSGTGSSSGTSTATAASTNIFPLSVSADGRYLKQNNGTPFLICANSTWSLAVNLPLADLSTFFSTITGQGFNTLMFNAIEHNYTVVKPPKERGSNLPFTKRLDAATYTGSPNGTSTATGTHDQFASDNYGSPASESPDPTFPNTTYWQAVESVLNACVSNNVLVFIWPAYLGFHAGDEGWMTEMVQWDAVTGAGGFLGQPYADNSKSKMWNYGAWLADRWKNYANIIWVAGGDYGSNTQTLNTAERAAVVNFIAGMKSVSGQASTLWTAHWDRPCISTDTTISGVTWNLNFAYADEAVAELCRRGYADSPVIPTLLGEYNYEDGLFGGSAPWRKYLYWGFLSGIAGGFFGNEPLWRVDTDYATHMNTQGANDAARQFTFWKSRPWHRLRPSGLGSIGTLVTAGGGTASPQSTDYVTAAATPEGDLLLAYVPPAHTGSVTVDMTKMSGTSQARWFDPTNATFTTIGTFNNTGTHAFTTPGNNNAGDADWLLVLETNAGTAAGTSTATATGASLATTVGTSPGTSTATALGRANASTVGTSSGISTAIASSSVISSAAGTSTGAGTATGVSSSTAASTGTSSGVSTGVAAGAATTNGVGSSSGTGVATAVGQITASTVGTSAGTSTANAPSSAALNGVGTAAGLGTATGASSVLTAGTGDSAGTSTANAGGSALSSGSGTTTGIGVASASSISTAVGVGTAGGTAIATAVGASLAKGAGSAAGISTVNASGQTLSAGDGTGNSSGTSTATAVALAFSAGAGQATGSGSASGIGTSLFTFVGSSSGISATTATGSSLASGTGSSAGIGTVSGIGAGNTSGFITGTSAGTSTAIGSGASVAAATGISSGTGSAFGSSIINKPAFQTPVIIRAKSISITPVIKLRRRR